MQYIVFSLGIVLSIIAIIYYCKLRNKYNDKKFILSIVTALFISIILELFSFNYDAYEMFGDDSISKTYQWNAATGQSTSGLSVEKNKKNKYTIRINQIDTVTKTMDLDFDGNAEMATCKLYFEDGANQKKFRQAWARSFVVVPKVQSTGHIKMALAGKTKALHLIMKTEHEPVSAIRIRLNQPGKFHIYFLRVLIVFLLLLFIFVISYSWCDELSFTGGKTKDTTKIKRKILIIIIIFTCGEVLWTVNLARESKKNFSLFKLDNETPDIYQELTLAFAQGKTNLNNLDESKKEYEQKTLERLLSLSNPYDYSERANYDKWDHAFYKGKFYCYYGIVPELLFYYPVYLVTGKLLNTHILTLFLCVLLIFAMTKFVYDIARRWKNNINICVLLCAILGFVNTSMIYFTMENSKFYEIAKISAMLASVTGLNFLYNAFSKERVSRIKLALGALCLAMAVGCRPNFILASALGMVIVVNGFIEIRSSGTYENILTKIKGFFKDIFCKENVPAILCYMLPYLIIGAGLMYYNYIRFDSVTEFGARYQLTLYDVHYYSFFDIRKLPTAIHDGLLSMPKFSAKYPFMKSSLQKGEFFGYEYKMKTFGLITYPLMWLLALLPWSLRRGIRDNKKRGIAVSAIILGLLSCYITAVMGGTGTGYTIDFAWLLYIPVIYILFDLYDRAKARNLTKYAVGVILALTFATVICSMLLSMSYDGKDISKKAPVLFYTLKEMIVFW